MATRLPPLPKWPHGRPTILCPICHGTGLNGAHAYAYVTSRETMDDATREAAVRCAGCDGRGRQMVAPLNRARPRGR